MVKITADILTQIAKAAAAPNPVTPNKAVVNGIVKNWKYATAAGIDTPNEAAAFLGQACIETDYFKTLREYWGPSDQQKKYDIASGSKLSKDLGNTVKGDGRLYMGRGIFQNTGRANYDELSRKLNVDLVTNPELLETPEYSMRAAVDYWVSRGLGKYAVVGNFTAVGRGINRGNPKSKSKAYHEAERLRACNRALTLLGKIDTVSSPPEIVMANPPSDYKGDQLIFYVQTLLDKKGWREVGTADGQMGWRTEGAILSYRNEAGLRNVKSIDQELVTSLETGPDRVVSQSRAATTASDLREAGDETIGTLDTQQKAVAASAAFTGFGLLDQLGGTDKAKQAVEGAGALREMAEKGLDLAQWLAQHWWLPVLLLVAYLYIKNRKVIAKRVEDHRTGKNVEF